MPTEPCVNQVAAESAELLGGVSALADDLVAATVAGRWPQPELVALVGCLRSQVIPRAVHEECGVFAQRVATAQIAQMHRDHRRLREATDVLARAAVGEGNRSTAHIAA